MAETKLPSLNPGPKTPAVAKASLPPQSPVVEAKARALPAASAAPVLPADVQKAKPAVKTVKASVKETKSTAKEPKPVLKVAKAPVKAAKAPAQAATVAPKAKPVVPKAAMPPKPIVEVPGEALRLALTEAATATTHGALAVNDKVLAAFRAQSDAAFDLVRSTLSAPSVAEALRLQAGGVRQVYETASSHWKDVAETARTWIDKSVRPIHSVWTDRFR
ncbi:phasin family protein [Microvirga sp. 2MCAF38]|uniref:phasin family protein n=1 Tax=Microvirga sp. 2MCAF38 TaxID=3232989 RepID=UPI003F9ADAEC